MSTFSRKTRNSAEWLRLRSEPLGLVRPSSVRIRIEHWELNIGQIPIGHSAKLFLLEEPTHCQRSDAGVLELGVMRPCAGPSFPSKTLDMVRADVENARPKGIRT